MRDQSGNDSRKRGGGHRMEGRGRWWSEGVGPARAAFILMVRRRQRSSLWIGMELTEPGWFFQGEAVVR